MRWLIAAIACILVAAPSAPAQVVGTTPAAHGGGSAAPSPLSPAVAPPALPLAGNTRVCGLGHSFIQRGSYSGSGTGAHGEDYLARGVLDQVRTQDGRFNLDIFAVDGTALGWSGQRNTNSLSGAMQGIGGDHLYAIGSSPGTINRSRYVLSRGCQIVYLDIGTNDINSGVGGPYGSDNSAASVIAALDRQISILTSHGVWVVVQTISYRFDYYSADPADPRLATIDRVNAWIKDQAGRTGVKICDTTAIDGTADALPVYDAGSTYAADKLIAGDGIHPLQALAHARAQVLLPILQSMVTAGDPRNLDPLSGNLLPNKGWPGTAGTFGSNGRITGQMATGWKATMQTGTSTAVASKHEISAGNEWQVFTVTPVADGTALHEILLTGADLTNANIGLVDGDWYEVYLPYQMDGWAGWQFNSNTGAGSVQLLNELYTGLSQGALAYECNDKAGYGGTSGVLACKVYIKPGLSIGRIRYSSRPIQIYFRSDVGGIGMIGIGSPIIRKISDPRAVWNLP